MRASGVLQGQLLKWIPLTNRQPRARYILPCRAPMKRTDSLDRRRLSIRLCGRNLAWVGAKLRAATAVLLAPSIASEGVHSRQVLHTPPATNACILIVAWPHVQNEFEIMIRGVVEGLTRKRVQIIFCHFCH